jgi:hypothetical protein
LVAPLRNFFAAIFFVSVGVLVNPSACWEYKGVILSLVMIVILGKGFNCFFMSLLTGQKVKDSVQTGFGLAQIGEFAYMVALLYMTIMHDPGHPMYQIVVAVSLITTCLNPIMLKISDPVGSFVESKMPELVRTWLSAYADWLNKFRRARVPNRLQRHMRVRFMWIIVIWILNICVAVGSTMLSNLDYSNFSMFFNTHKKFVFCIREHSTADIPAFHNKPTVCGDPVLNIQNKFSYGRICSNQTGTGSNVCRTELISEHTAIKKKIKPAYSRFPDYALSQCGKKRIIITIINIKRGTDRFQRNEPENTAGVQYRYPENGGDPTRHRTFTGGRRAVYCNNRRTHVPAQRLRP